MVGKKSNFASEKKLRDFVAATDYLSVAQIFLRDNFLLERTLEFGDVKKRLIGHFGTCHGINVAYAYLNAWIRSLESFNPDVLFVLGDGHGLPALNANLFVEGTLGDFYGCKVDAKGVGWLCKSFSSPNGFPSHASPMSPGAICEGGELGYSLGIGFGAALDNPQIIVPVLIGDGEAETAALLASLNLPRLISMNNNGMVLPILHCNGYKIGGPSIYGRMTNDELRGLFGGFGWEVVVVDEEAPSFHKDFVEVLQKSFEIFKKLKSGSLARPMLIVFRSRKGEGGLETLNGSKIAGNNLSHQVVLEKANSDAAELKLLGKWLRGYEFKKVFQASVFDEVLPKKDLRMGRNRQAFGGHESRLALDLPDLSDDDWFDIDFSDKVCYNKGIKWASSALEVGEVLRDCLAVSDVSRDFRFFCPDETASNKLAAVYEATSRSWQLPIAAWDKDLSRDGRVTEMLSENTLFSLLEGYTLTGRRGVLASYEAFAEIMTSQATQYVKFLLQKKGLAWWGRVPALNILLTSVGWRQDHNGFSHQNPGFMSERLMRPTGVENVFLPFNALAATYAMRYAVSESWDAVNTIVCGKTNESQWFSRGDALMRYCLGEGQGAFAYDFMDLADSSVGDDFDVSVWGIGDYVSSEVLLGIELLQKYAPSVRVRFVSVNILSNGHFGVCGNEMSLERFEKLAGSRPMVVNFHGYVSTIKSIFANYCDVRKVAFAGYEEKGTTTTPLLLQILNKTDRFSVAVRIVEAAMFEGVLAKKVGESLRAKFLGLQSEAVDFANKNNLDKD
ncbi:MAG: phosphoketolase family protein [Candidatus Nomurabacteria bacterium]|jgi:xylulose-5-phosphate/fructose-6-phosphate phosphoketolase|nr:phosphoketolase family protein [Candidatus Nomurabacteria bacterium]